MYGGGWNALLNSNLGKMGQNQFKNDVEKIGNNAINKYNETKNTIGNSVIEGYIKQKYYYQQLIKELEEKIKAYKFDESHPDGPTYKEIKNVGKNKITSPIYGNEYRQYGGKRSRKGRKRGSKRSNHRTKRRY